MVGQCSFCAVGVVGCGEGVYLMSLGPPILAYSRARPAILVADKA